MDQVLAFLLLGVEPFNGRGEVTLLTGWVSVVSSECRQAGIHAALLVLEKCPRSLVEGHWVVGLGCTLVAMKKCGC